MGTLSGNVATNSLNSVSSGTAGGVGVVYGGGGGATGVVIGAGSVAYNALEGFTWDNTSASFQGFKTGTPKVASSGSSGYFELQDYWGARTSF